MRVASSTPRVTASSMLMLWPKVSISGQLPTSTQPGRFGDGANVQLKTGTPVAILSLNSLLNRPTLALKPLSAT